MSDLYKAKKRIKAIDASLQKQDIEYLQEICDDAKTKASENFHYTIEWSYAHEDDIINNNIKAFKALQKARMDVPIIPCLSCMKLCSKKDVRHTDEFYPNNKAVQRVWDDLLHFHEQQLNDCNYICNYCFGKFKEGAVPPTCILNGLEVKDPPLCITRLNDYERVFMQRVLKLYRI